MCTLEIKEKCSEIMDEVIRIRRDIHKNPELGFNEYRTSSIASDFMKNLGFSVRTNVAKTGVVGVLEGERPGKTIAIRADMDAIPIAEENDFEYASQNKNVMHACGHDAHIAIALELQRYFIILKTEYPAMSNLFSSEKLAEIKYSERLIAKRD